MASEADISEGILAQEQLSPNNVVKKWKALLTESRPTLFTNVDRRKKFKPERSSGGGPEARPKEARPDLSLRLHHRVTC
jgi:hypothetical protein